MLKIVTCIATLINTHNLYNNINTHLLYDNNYLLAATAIAA